MAIVQFTRFKSDKPEEMVKTAKQAKAIFEKHGVNFFGFPGFTPVCGPGSFSSLRAIPAGKCTARYRKHWQRTKRSRSCGRTRPPSPN